MSYYHNNSIATLERIRWNGQPTCPYCGSTKATAYKNVHRYHCNNCFTSYSVTVGTLFHKTHVDLKQWFQAIHLVAKTSAPITVRRLSKEIGVSKNTALYMISRIQKAVTEESELLHKVLELEKS